MEEITEKNTFFFDIERTLLRWDETLIGAEELVSRLRDAGKRVRFHTDNSLISRKAYARRLTDNGISAEESDILSSTYVATEHLYKNDVSSVYTVGESGLIEELERRDIKVSRDAENTVVGLDRKLTYDKISEIMDRSSKGRIFTLSNQRFFEKSSGMQPNQGVINAAIREFSETKNLGKPSEEFQDIFRNYFSYYPGNSVMIGDRKEDIILGNELGMTTVAVMSGELDEEQLRKAEGLEEPDFGLSSLHRLSKKII
ncbi:HAD hydrolase-like protein [Candidatus Nanohaloarchaea archaeon]|nr:HAD hydrolase-like protein [Candidatus Nanohaloarchaea archaeon]